MPRIFLPGLLETPIAGISFPDEHLLVDKTYLLKTDETNDAVNVTCNLCLTNIWEKESGEIKAVAYVIETENNFAVLKLVLKSAYSMQIQLRKLRYLLSSRIIATNFMCYYSKMENWL